MPNTMACGVYVEKKGQKSFQGCRGSDDHGWPVVILSGPWLRVLTYGPFLFPIFHSTLSLSSSPSLSKTSIAIPSTFLHIHTFHPKFLSNSSNFFLFLQFLHKSFNLHPKFIQNLHLFSSSSILDLLLTISNSSSFFSKIPFLTSILFLRPQFL